MLPTIPEACQHNAHIYYLILASHIDRNAVLKRLKQQNVHAVFHYIPLHNSPAGIRYGKVSGSMVNTDHVSEKIVRLPLWAGMTDSEIDRVIDVFSSAVS